MIKWTSVIAMTALFPAVAALAPARAQPPLRAQPPVRAQPPLRDSVSLNIGLACQWQKPCIAQQQRAMKRALSFVSKKQPAVWRIQQCNRNAARTRHRVDWIGFDNCIRNAALRVSPRPAPLRKSRRFVS